MRFVSVLVVSLGLLASSSALAAPPAFVKVAPLPSGPVAVKGFPHSIRNGMNDPALRVGFTSDGTLFGYCAEGGGRDPMTTFCEWLDKDSRATTMSSDANGSFDAKKKKAIDAFLKDSAIPEIKSDVPPALKGTWSFTDITLDVLRVAASPDKDGNPVNPALVKLGGSVGSEPPVHPIVLSNNPIPHAPPHFAVMNGLAISPNNEDIGMLGHFFACEYCDSFLAKRMPLASLASQIYNDTGFRAHGRKDFAKSAALFEKAVNADPSARLPPYNLACAWAHTGDARAKDALAYAISLDAGAKTRAKADKDFDGVRTQPWFVDLTR